jgi:hypothetical protein
MDEAPHDVLFLPGPVEVDPELRAISRSRWIRAPQPALQRRDVPRICRKLGPLIRTGAHTLWRTCRPRGSWRPRSATIVERRVLHLTCGAFSVALGHDQRVLRARGVALPGGGVGRAQRARGAARRDCGPRPVRGHHDHAQRDVDRRPEPAARAVRGRAGSGAGDPRARRRRVEPRRCRARVRRPGASTARSRDAEGARPAPGLWCSPSARGR